MTTTMAEIAALVGGTVRSPLESDVSVTSFTHDSRKAAKGGLFACVRGDAYDGHAFARQAVDAGVAGLLVEEFLDLDIVQILVSDVRLQLGPIANLVYAQPSASLTAVGVTGTAGKTTIVHLLQQVLTYAGVRTELIGTLTGARTTPEAPDLQSLLAEMVRRGTEVVAMEVSSHAMSLGRVDCTHFDVSIFTNLGHDHLDFHHTIEEYREAKAELFTPRYTETSVINRDDAVGHELLKTVTTSVVSYGLNDAKDLRFIGPRSEFTWRGQHVSLNLAGEYNVLNALAVATAAVELGHAPSIIAEALSTATAPAGRFEVLTTRDGFHVAIDYAHKPEALAASLKAARQVAGDARVIVVFGCGGDRDREKRPLMGAAAMAGADYAFVTTDNPRTESPSEIIHEILVGMPQAGSFVVEEDRKTAIEMALDSARSGDVVLIAGKGHETYQEVRGQSFKFDDRLTALAHLERSQ